MKEKEHKEPHSQHRKVIIAYLSKRQRSVKESYQTGILRGKVLRRKSENKPRQMKPTNY